MLPKRLTALALICFHLRECMGALNKYDGWHNQNYSTGLYFTWSATDGTSGRMMHQPAVIGTKGIPEGGLTLNLTMANPINACPKEFSGMPLKNECPFTGQPLRGSIVLYEYKPNDCWWAMGPQEIFQAGAAAFLFNPGQGHSEQDVRSRTLIVGFNTERFEDVTGNMVIEIPGFAISYYDRLFFEEKLKAGHRVQLTFPGSGPIDPNDRRALVALYDAMESDPTKEQPDGTVNRDGVTVSNTFGNKNLNMDVDWQRGGNGQPMWHVLKDDPSWDPCTGIRIFGVWCEGGRVVAITTPFMVTRIKRLPAEIGLLTELRVLNFGWHAWWDKVILPCEMSQMKSLQSLIIVNLFGADNNITVPGCAVEGMSKLEELVVYNSKLRWLPDELYELPTLKKIIVQKNEIESFGTQFGLGRGYQNIGIPQSLEVLVMSENKLAGDVKDIIGHKLKNHPSIQGVELKGNQLKGELPEDSFDGCPNLEELYLTGSGKGGARCSGRLPQFRGTTNIKVLDLGENDFSGGIPEPWAKMNLVEQLKLKGNQIECPNGTMPGLLNKPAIRVLDLSHNQLMTPPFGVVDGKPIMQVNSILSWLGQYIGPHIEVLDLSHNKLSGTGAAALPVLRKMRIADFSYNELGPGYMLASNDLEGSEYSEFSVIDFSHNNFTQLADASNIPAPFLTRLKLDHNPYLKATYAGMRAPAYFKPQKYLEDGCRITSDFVRDSAGDQICPFTCPKWVGKDKETTILDLDPVVYGYLGDVSWYESQFPSENYSAFFGDRLCKCKEGFHGDPPNCVRDCVPIFEFRPVSGGACKPCPDHATCFESIIVCESGYFRVPGENRCAVCAGGLDCNWKGLSPEDSSWRQSAPRTLPGYWAPRSNASWTRGTYTCADVMQCPGGELETCASGRTGIACGKCFENHYVSGNGQCRECNMPQDGSLSFVALGLACAVLGVVLRTLKVPFAKLKPASVAIGLAASLTLTALQSLSAFHRLQITWPGPFRALLDGIAFVTLNFDILRFQCVVTKDDTLTNYLMKLFIVPAVIAIIFVSVGVAKRLGHTEMTKSTAINVSGLVLSSFFIPICITSFEPWQCLDNSNGISTILAMPHVECGSDMHNRLLALSACAVCLYPVCFLSICIFYTLSYKKYIMKYGVDFLDKTRFIFCRFKPRNYHFGVLFLLRSFCISVIPIIFVNYVVMQILLMTVALLLWIFAELTWKPWRVRIVNVASGVMSFCLIITLLCGALVIDPVANSAWKCTTHFLVLSFFCLFIGLLFPFIAGLKKHLNKEKRFDFFLCHHKGGGGALARWVQMLLAEQTSGNIFLDSDCLEDLENIFDMVKSDTKNVLVLLTKETLRRMWCAGEIASAWKNDINVVKLVCSDFEELTEDFFSQQLPQFFSAEQLATLANGGISYRDIESAYRHLATAPSVSFQRDGSIADQMTAVKKVVQHSAGLKLKLFNRISSFLPNLLSSNHRNSPNIEASCDKTGPVKFLSVPAATDSIRPIVVLGDGLTAETVVSCRILQQLLQTESRLGVETLTIGASLTPNDLSATKSAKYVFVLLTNELMSNPAAIALLALLTSQKGAPEIVTCSIDRSFCFPSLSFYSDIVKGKALSEGFVADVHGFMTNADSAFVRQDNHSLSLSLIAGAYRELFTKLSLPFSPQGSKEVIDVEVQGLLRRLKHDKNSSRTKSESETKGAMQKVEINEDEFLNVV